MMKLNSLVSSLPARLGWAPDAADDGAHYISALGMATIAIVFGGLALWSLLAPIAGAVIAPGMVQVDGSRKLVQHLQGGIVKELDVKEGDLVQAGQLLLRLDDTVARAQLNLLDGNLVELEARQARLTAERDGASDIRFPADLVARISQPRVREAIDGQINLFHARAQSRATEKDILEQKIGELEDQIRGFQAQEQSEDRQVKILERQIASVQSLYKKGYETLTKLLELQGSAESLRGQRGAHDADISSAKTSIGETEISILQIDRKFQEDVINELRDLQPQLVQVTEQRIAAADTLRRTDILAPYSGRVLDLSVHTVGGVISAGAPLMEIVPVGADLVVNANVRPQDIDKVHVGEGARIRLTSLNRRTTPEILGTVRVVSADRVADKDGKLSYYTVKISFPNSLPTGIREALVPGLPAEIFIEAGAQSAITYLTKPLTDTLSKSFRDQ